MSFGKLGAMGRGFGHLGALGRAGTSGSLPGTPNLLLLRSGGNLTLRKGGDLWLHNGADMLLRAGGNLSLRSGGILRLQNPKGPSTSPLVQPAAPALSSGMLRALPSRAMLGEPAPLTIKATDRHTVQCMETNTTGETITGMRVAFYNGSLAATAGGETASAVSRPVRVDIWDGVQWNNAINRTYAAGETTVETEITLANPILPGGTWGHWTSTTASDFTFAVPRIVWGDYGDWASYDSGSGVPLAPAAGLHASLGAGIPAAAWTPLGIYGRTASGATRRSVVIFGDSIATGNGGGEDQSIPKKAYGYLERALVAANLGVIKCTVPSGTLFTVTQGITAAQQAAIQNGGVSDAFIEYGINDFSGGRSYAEVYSRIQILAAWLKGMGIRVHLMTITPKVTTTDSLATTAGQVVVSGDANSWNAKLRSHYTDARPIPNVDHVHDVAALLEEGIGTGFAKINPSPFFYFKSEGGSPATVVHPQDVGHALAATGITISKVLA